MKDIITDQELEIIAASWENKQCGFQSGLKQTELYKHRRWLETGTFGFRKKNCTIHVAKTKALISFKIMSCIFVFAYTNCWFSHDVAHIVETTSVVYHVCNVTDGVKYRLTDSQPVKHTLCHGFSCCM